MNDAPVARDDVASTSEDTAVVVNVLGNDTDVDGVIDPTSVTASPPANGTVSVDPVTGEITYTPNPDFSGGDTFDYQVCDDGGACNTATVTITVNPVNDVPEARDDVASTSEDTAVVVNVLGNDTDIDGVIDPTSVTASPQAPPSSQTW